MRAKTFQTERLNDLLQGEILEVRGHDDETGGLVRLMLLLRRKNSSGSVTTRRVAIDCLPATSGPFIDADTISDEEWNELN